MAKFTGVQKAAILLMQFGKDRAVPVLRALREDEVSEIMAEVARSFVETLTRGGAGRIKFCQNNNCRWLFYDETKAKSRRWCSSKSCGNRERVRRARAREKH